MSSALKTVGMTMMCNRCDVVNIRTLAVILVLDFFKFNTQPVMEGHLWEKVEEKKKNRHFYSSFTVINTQQYKARKN